jgi:hypothetical protein
MHHASGNVPAATSRRIWGVENNGHAKNEPLQLHPISCSPLPKRFAVPPGFLVARALAVEQKVEETQMHIRLSYYPLVAESGTWHR